MGIGITVLGYGHRLSGRIPIEITRLAAGDVPPTSVVVGNFQGYAFTIADDGQFSFPLPDDYLPGTDIDLYVRWACNETYAANTGEVRWEAYYQTVANDMSQAIGAGTGGTLNSGDINLPAAARRLRENRIGIIPAANIDLGDTIRVDIERVALVAGNNPVQEPEIYAVFLDYIRFLPYYGE